MDYDAVEYAARQAESEERYRAAYGLWKQLVTDARNNQKFKEPGRLVGWKFCCYWPLDCFRSP